MQIVSSRNESLLKLYVLAVVAGAVAAFLMVGGAPRWDASATFLNGFIAILALAIAAQVTSVSVNVGTARMSMAFIPFLAGVFLFDPFWAMCLGGITFLVVEALVSRKPFVKILFNTSKEILVLAITATVWHALGGRSSITTFTVAPIAVVGTAIAYTAVNSITVSVAVALSEGMPFGQVWSRIYGGTVLYDIFASPIPALLAYLYTWRQLGGVALVALPLFVVRHIYIMNRRLEQGNRDLLGLMVKNIEARDPYTSGHSQRVAEYARLLAKEAGVSFRQIEQVVTAALLHDIGKTFSEFATLLQKDGALTPEERSLLQSHPVRSAELVHMISSLRGPVEKAVRHHHENYDGSGYPDGLTGEDIPLGARIIMVADTLDAMTTDRPYRKALSFERVVEEVKKYSGKQFDPRLADIVIKAPSIRRLVAKASSAAFPQVPASMLAPPTRSGRAAAIPFPLGRRVAQE
jgi:HD-GYP domain-containing protein (c-di-GMP phosphodiesterase class II)